MVKSSSKSVVGFSPEPPPVHKKPTRLTWVIAPPSSIELAKDFHLHVRLDEVPTEPYVPAHPISGKKIYFRKNGAPWMERTTNGNGLAKLSDVLWTEGTYTYFAEFKEDAEYYGCDLGTILDVETEALAWLSQASRRSSRFRR